MNWQRTRELIREDRRIHGGKRFRLFLLLFRLGAYCHANSHKSAYAVLKILLAKPYGLLCHAYGGYLPFTVKMGKGVHFRHEMYGVFISQDCVIGNDVTIHQHVTLGSNHGTGERAGSPVIGDGAYIGVNACVIGKIEVGANARIGAGAVAVKNIPAGATAVGVPAKVVKSAAACMAAKSQSDNQHDE